MSIESIKQNAQNIIEAYKIYNKLISEKNPDKEKIGKMKRYILKLSTNIKKSIEELR